MQLAQAPVLLLCAALGSTHIIMRQVSLVGEILPTDIPWSYGMLVKIRMATYAFLIKACLPILEKVRSQNGAVFVMQSNPSN